MTTSGGQAAFLTAACLSLIGLGLTLQCQDPTNEDYCIEVGYNKDRLPPNPPLNVTMSIVLSEVSNVDDSSRSISMRFVFYIYWNDSRVVRLKEGDRSIQLGMKNVDKYFLPDFYIYDLLDFQQSKFADPLKAILLTPKGLMWFYMEGILTTGCSMDFDSYPYDSHRCKYIMGSTGFPDSLMTFAADVSYSPSGQRPLQYVVSIEQLKEEEKLTVYASGNYSVAGFWIKLERKIFGHVLQIILPSAMFVVVSWISFLMPLNGGERAGLLVTLFLVLVSMFLSVVTTAPKASTLTAMETWVVGCLVFVFLALIEYGLVLRVMNQSKQKRDQLEGESKARKKRQTLIRVLKMFESKRDEVAPTDLNSAARSNASASAVTMGPEPSMDFLESIDESAKHKSHKLDQIAFIVLPIIFLIFNIIYWTTYLA